jgi:hypothetical protein
LSGRWFEKTGGRIMFLLNDQSGRIVTGWSFAGLLIAATLSIVFGSDPTLGLMG